MIKLFFGFLIGVVTGAFYVTADPSGVVSVIATLIKALVQ